MEQRVWTIDERGDVRSVAADLAATLVNGRAAIATHPEYLTRRHSRHGNELLVSGQPPAGTERTVLTAHDNELSQHRRQAIDSSRNALELDAIVVGLG